MSMLWNLWAWDGRRWFVVMSYGNEKDAAWAANAEPHHADKRTIARLGTPKDNYMRDNATVRHAPQNYLRIRHVEQPGDVPEKVVDHTARGSFDT